MRRALQLMLVAFLLLATSYAATVVVIPPYSNTQIQDLGTEVAKRLQTYFDTDGRYIFYASRDNDILYLKRSDGKSVVVDTKQGIGSLGGVVVNDGIVSIGFTYAAGTEKRYGGFKLYTTDLNPISQTIYCVPYINPTISDGYASDTMYVKCGHSVQPNDPNVGRMFITLVRVYPVNDGGEYKFNVVVGATYIYESGGDIARDSYFGITQVTNLNDEFIVKLQRLSGGFVSEVATGAVLAKVVHPRIALFMVTRSQDQQYSQYIMLAKLVETVITDPNDPSKSYTAFGIDSPLVSFYWQVGFLLDHLSMTSYSGTQLALMYDGNLLVYNEEGQVYLNLTNELNKLGYTVLQGELTSYDIPKRVSLAKADGSILLVSVPVLKDGVQSVRLFAYTPQSGLVEVRELGDFDGALYGNGDVIYLVGPDQSGNVKIKKFEKLWVIAEPPYFQDPPGSTLTVQLKTTLPVDLEEVNKPDFVEIDLPEHVDPPSVDVSISISSSAPEDSYGIIRFTYYAVGEDGHKDSFESGIIFRTTQVNDPPTTPDITDIYVDESGNIVVSWLASTDPDGDEVYYNIAVYDETADEQVVSDTTVETQYSFPGTVNHTYRIEVTASDGNLVSNTAIEYFTYEWEASVEIVMPKSGIYVVQSLPVRVVYQTNTPATLTVLKSADGVTWDVVDTTNVNGNGIFETSVDLLEGVTYLQAKLELDGEERLSNIVELTYSSNIQYNMYIIEPQDGAVYQTEENATVMITFTAAFTINEPGIKNEKIVVYDDNGNQIVVAVADTEENYYILTSTYALGEGNYVVYPVYEDMNGNLFFGTPSTFSVVVTETPNNPPSTPIPYDIGSTTSTTVRLMWRQSVDPDGDPVTYYVEVATDEFFQNVVYIGTTIDTYIDVNSLYGGHVYYWRVKACDQNGLCSAWSSYDDVAVLESTGVEVIYPTDGSSFVANENNELELTIAVGVLSNTDKHFNLYVYLDSNLIGQDEFNGPMDETINIPVTVGPGDYNIEARMVETETNDVYLSVVHIKVFAYGEEQPPVIQLIDPQNGYIDTVTDLNPKTPITARASFTFVKTGTHTVAIEYKLRWALAWNTLTEQVVDANSGDSYSLTDTVELGEGIYLFRAKVVDPDGVVWTSETHTVYIQKQQVTPPSGGEEGNQPGGGGGGGGGAGGAPILAPEKVTWSVSAGRITNVTIEVKNVGTSPLKVKIMYKGDIGNYIISPADGSPMVLPPGEYNIVFRVDPKDLEPGSKVTGTIILAPTGTTIEIPVEMVITEGGEGGAQVDLSGVLIPIMIIAGLVVIYLLVQGVI